MNYIFYNRIIPELKEGRFVGITFESSSKTISRAVVKDVAGKGKVKTAYGTVLPKEIYSFDNSTELMEFVDATPK